MNTVGPAISLRTSCWLFPQKEQYSVFLVSLFPLDLLILLTQFPVGCPATDWVCHLPNQPDDLIHQGCVRSD